jgi:hypothetical protein
VTLIPGVILLPLGDWPGELTPEDERRSRYQFQADWPSTAKLLTFELRKIDARDAVLQLAIIDDDLRLDGNLRTNAKPEHPGVVLSFESQHGPLQFACDTYEYWRHNVRAIALTLQALRAVDRYGATQAAEQYRGFAALPPPPPKAGERMTVEQAARFIAEHATAGGYPCDPDDVLGPFRQDAYRAAARRLHPDRGGNADDFVRLNDAKKLIDQHAGGET